jgi:hypothetical protein
VPYTARCTRAPILPPIHLECAVQNSPIAENTSGTDPPTPKPASIRSTNMCVRVCDAADSMPNTAFMTRARSSDLRRPAGDQGGSGFGFCDEVKEAEGCSIGVESGWQCAE